MGSAGVDIPGGQELALWNIGSLSAAAAPPSLSQGQLPAEGQGGGLLGAVWLPWAYPAQLTEAPLCPLPWSALDTEEDTE